MVLMDKHIVNQEKPLTIDKLQEEKCLRFERLAIKPESRNEINWTEKKALFTLQFRAKCRIWKNRSHKVIDCKVSRLPYNPI